MVRGAVQPLVLDIDGEKDIEVLREAMKRLLVENERLSATILKLTKQLLTAVSYTHLTLPTSDLV